VKPPRWHPRGLNNGLIFGLTYYGVRHLPRRVTHALGRGGSWLAYRLQRSGREALVENARPIVPDFGERELRRLARGTYAAYARDTVDFIRSLSMTTADLGATVDVMHVDALHAAMAAGRGALAVLPHFGNWELGGVIMQRLTPYRMAVVAMRESNDEVHRRRLAFRHSMDIETLEVGQALDTALRIRATLARNCVVAVLVDRHVEKDRVEVTFFGRRAYFLRTPALLACATGAPLLPTFVYRQPGAGFIVECGPAIYVAPDGNREENIQRAMQAVSELFEAQIRNRPEYWYQFYPYWATQETTSTEAVSPASRPGDR
jgi:KDO2-lipid IV(A) lauroyltransferase